MLLISQIFIDIMRSIFFFQILFLFSPFLIAAQEINIAIIDFENKTENPKYSGLGKAMSSMLISDLTSNLSSKKIGFIERLQINKVLGEQKIQKQLFIDQNSTVRAGKILGVKYLLLGDVFVMNNDLIINARLTDVESGQIKFSKKQEGTIAQWLNLKSSIAKELTSALNLSFVNPIKVEKDISPSTLSSYSQVIEAKDNNDLTKAENLIKNLANSDLGMNYLNGLKNEINSIKKEVAENSNKINKIESVNARQDLQINALEKSGGRVINAKSYKELYHNLQSDLNTPEESKKILINILNNYPQQFQENFEVLFFVVDYGMQLNTLSKMNDGMKFLLDLCKTQKNKEYINNLIVHYGSLNAQNLKHDDSSNNFSDFEKLYKIFSNALNQLQIDSVTKSLIEVNFLTKFIFPNSGYFSSSEKYQYKALLNTKLYSDFKYYYSILTSFEKIVPSLQINDNRISTSISEIKISLFQSNVSKEQIWDKICDFTYVLNYLVKDQMNSLRLYPDPIMQKEDLKYRLFHISDYELSEKEYSNAWQNLMK